MILSAEWLNANGDPEAGARERLFAYEMKRSVDGNLEALRCMYNQAINYPNTHHRYWAIHTAALVRAFGDRPNRDGNIFGVMMRLNFTQELER